MKCVNLRSFGRPLCWDESRQGLERDPWLLRIKCQIGHIYPHSDTHLGLSVDGHPIIANRLAENHRLFTVVQDGNDGVNLIFHKRNAQEVFEIAKAKKKRVVSPEVRAKLVEQLRRARSR